MKAILYNINGSEKEVTPINGEKFSLEEMYSLINTDIVQLAVGATADGELGDMWCDEEGLLKANWQINHKATSAYRAAHPDLDPDDLVIVGNALFVVPQQQD
jgi:hypothetical protein